MDGSILSGAVGGSIASVIGTICFSIALWYVKRLIRERDLLAENRLTGFETSLRDQKSRLDQHIKEDKTQVVLTKLTGIEGNIQKLLDQQQALLIADSEQKQQIITLFHDLKEQKDNLKECQKEHKK